jgi:hypothetical protein
MAIDRDELVRLLKLQYAEIDRLRALVGRKDLELDALVGWIMGEGDALSALQAIYADPRQSPANVIKASGLALPFERAKPAGMVIIEENWMEKTRRIRLETQAKNRAQWALEDQSKIIEGTVLGSPEDEPAA